MTTSHPTSHAPAVFYAHRSRIHDSPPAGLALALTIAVARSIRSGPAPIIADRLCRVPRALVPMCVRRAHTPEVEKGVWSRQRLVFVGSALVGVVLVVTWVVLYLTAGDTSAP